MTRTHKIELWIALLVALLLTVGILALIRWQGKTDFASGSRPRRRIRTLENNCRSRELQSPLAISLPPTPQSDSSGFFVLKLRKPIRRGHPIVLDFRHPQYQPLDLNEYVTNKLYVVHLVPLSSNPAPRINPKLRWPTSACRYTVKAKTELNVGSAVKTFEIENKGNVPCKGQHPCSPDGKWKAAFGSATLDAGADNEFRNARASCIAGPCPFTRIEADHFSQGGQIITVSARDWSDTTTFLLEAEVFRPMVSQMEHWSYPVIFGEGLSFTLPSAAESVSIEADLDGQTIIFPLGPSLFLSWATCDAGVNPDKGAGLPLHAQTGISLSVGIAAISPRLPSRSFRNKQDLSSRCKRQTARRWLNLRAVRWTVWD